MDLLEQLQIVALQADIEFQRLLMVVCLSVLGAGALVGLAALFFRTFTPMIRWVKEHIGQAAFVVPFVVCCIYVGSTKSIIGRVTYPFTDPETRYLIDAGSFVTNDYVHVEFTKSQVVPDSADFLGYVRPSGSTNDEEWVEFLSSTFTEFHSPSNVPYAGAISNDFQFFTTYTPGPVVHTNGVAVVVWQQAGTNRTHFVPVRTGIYLQGHRMAPNPAMKNGPSVSLTVNLNNGGSNE